MLVVDTNAVLFFKTAQISSVFLQVTYLFSIVNCPHFPRLCENHTIALNLCHLPLVLQYAQFLSKL